MKKVCSWLFSPLIVLAGISPVWAQVPVKAAQEVVTIANGGKAAVETALVSPLALEAIGTMRQALATTGTKAATLAKVPSQEGWALQVRAANFAPAKGTISPLRAAQLAQNPNSQPSTFTLLANYPAIAIEGKTVLGQAQVERALATYQDIIQAKFRSGFVFKHWGELMSAVTNTGFFATKESANLVLSAATKENFGILTGPTDVIVVRALLNLGAFDKIQALANVRLQSIDGNSTPLKLPYEWSAIQEYMNEVGVELNIPQNRIAPAPAQSTLSRMPTAEAWLLYYNPYNAFMADPSAATTKNFLKLREGMKQKVTTLQVTQAVDNSLSGNK